MRCNAEGREEEREGQGGGGGGGGAPLPAVGADPHDADVVCLLGGQELREGAAQGCGLALAPLCKAVRGRRCVASRHLACLNRRGSAEQRKSQKEANHRST